MAFRLNKIFYGTLITAAALSFNLRAQNIHYPMWMTPAKSELTGEQAISGGELGGKAYSDALRVVRYALEREGAGPFRPWYMYQLANGFYEMGEIDSAISFFKALELLPETAVFADIPNFNDLEAARTAARIGLARCYANKKDVDNSVRYLNMILPRNDADRLLLAELQFSLNRRNSAQTLLNQTAKLEMPSELKIRAGILLRQMSLDEEAMKYFKSAADSATLEATARQAAQMVKLAAYKVPGPYADGVYTGSAPTVNGIVAVSVKIKSRKIAEITFTSRNYRTPWNAYKSVPARMIANNNVLAETVIGAEDLVTAIQMAVSEALQKSRLN